jgi:hypothetical protein
LNRKILGKFSEEYHSLKDANGGKSRLIVFADVKPIPPPLKRVDYPEVTIWSKADYACAIAKTNKGELNSELSTPKPKGKAGQDAHAKENRMQVFLKNFYRTTMVHRSAQTN